MLSDAVSLDGSKRICQQFLEFEECEGEECNEESRGFNCASFSHFSFSGPSIEADLDDLQTLIARAMQSAETARVIAFRHKTQAAQRTDELENSFQQSAANLLKRKRNVVSPISLKRMKPFHSLRLSIDTAEFPDLEFLAQKVSEYMQNNRLTIEEKKELAALIVSEKNLSIRDQVLLKSRIQFLLRSYFYRRKRTPIDELFREIRVKSNDSGINNEMQRRRMDRINELLSKTFTIIP